MKEHTKKTPEDAISKSWNSTRQTTSFFNNNCRELKKDVGRTYRWKKTQKTHQSITIYGSYLDSDSNYKRAPRHVSTHRVCERYTNRSMRQSGGNGDTNKTLIWGIFFRDNSIVATLVNPLFFREIQSTIFSGEIMPVIWGRLQIS